MQRTITRFDTKRHHIHIRFYVMDHKSNYHSLDGIIDTGASRTEFSDKFLSFAGLIEVQDKEIQIKPGQQTQKYGRIFLPSIEIFGVEMKNFPVFASRFEVDWGIDALIGLDIFRIFDVTISYNRSIIITEQLYL